MPNPSSRTVYDLQRFSVCTELLSVSAKCWKWRVVMITTPMHVPPSKREGVYFTRYNAMYIEDQILLIIYYKLLSYICRSRLSSRPPPHFKALASRILASLLPFDSEVWPCLALPTHTAILIQCYHELTETTTGCSLSSMHGSRGASCDEQLDHLVREATNRMLI